MKQNKKNKILIVEDEADLRNAYSEALSSKECEVITAANGQEGLEAARKNAPDLILLDILMPVMDGLAMLQKLRQGDEHLKKVPVILLTNLSANSEDVIKKVAETEPVYYIVKTSFSLKQIVDKVKEFLPS